jgi:chromosomal replication initiator protein
MSGDQLEFGDDERSIALRRAWESTLRSLSGQVNKVTFESYIRPLRPVSFDGSQAVLGVSSAFAREWLKRYATLIQATLEREFAGLLECPLEVKFSLLSSEDKALFKEVALGQLSERVNSTDRRAQTRAARQQPADVTIPSLPLNPRYVFDSFVIGKSNRLAHAGAVAVAAAPGSIYNPLFVYGSSGLGKTHLLHAIGYAATAHYPQARIALVDGEHFTQQYVGALRERKMEEFRRHYRSIDLWLVDDIQFVAGREQTKEEFFHTFNALYQTGKQIVITSDRSPRELRMMDERLRSRFESGLIADINSPELEVRVAILERRCEIEKLDVPREVIYYIAGAIQSNIRALDGALTRLVAYSSVMNSPHSIEMAQNVLVDYFIEKPTPGKAKAVGMDTIQLAVAEQFGLTVEAITSQRRDKEVAAARQVAMYLCRELTQTALSQIGAVFGGRDHTTVQRAIAKIEALLPYDKPLQHSVHQLRQKLQQ